MLNAMSEVVAKHTLAHRVLKFVLHVLASDWSAVPPWAVAVWVAGATGVKIAPARVQLRALIAVVAALSVLAFATSLVRYHASLNKDERSRAFARGPALCGACTGIARRP